jgi:hypothetical protein
MAPSEARQNPSRLGGADAGCARGSPDERTCTPGGRAGAYTQENPDYRAAQIANPSAHKAGRPTALTVSEEKAVVDLIVQHADGVQALATSDVADAVAAIVSRMPEARRRSVPVGTQFLRVNLIAV